MMRKIQKRTLETRAKLLDAATDLIAEQGYAALRVEDVVKKAGVAKGTFFAHFKDKDRLLERLLGEKMATLLDDIERQPAPTDIEGVMDTLQALHDFMTCERAAFDVILRYSGAAAEEEIGPIAECFYRYEQVLTKWFEGDHPFRKDQEAHMLASGIQAFALQTMSLNYCALNSTIPFRKRFSAYLKAWLIVPVTAVSVQPSSASTPSKRYSIKLKRQP